MRIGFIGLGRMGSGLAGNLLKAGYDLAVYDINPQAQEALQVRGARGASTLLELARQVDVLFTSLPLPGDVTGVLLGETDTVFRVLHPLVASVFLAGRPQERCQNSV